MKRLCYTLRPKLKQGESGANRVWAKYRNNAKVSNREFLLSKEQFMAIVSSPCFYCGTPPKQLSCESRIRKRGISVEYATFLYNGIDRQDNSKGYIDGNCVPCCRICNRAKGELPLEDFYTWLRTVYNRVIC